MIMVNIIIVNIIIVNIIMVVVMSLTWESPHVMQLLRPHKRENISSMLGLKKQINCCGEKKTNPSFHPLSVISSPTNLHPAARVQERAPSSSSGGSSPSSYCIHKIIVNNQISFICFGARSDGRTFCGGMFVGILLKTNLPYQAPHTLHNIQICDA